MIWFTEDPRKLQRHLKMRYFNFMRRDVRAGLINSTEPRLNRALGLYQGSGPSPEYAATTLDCNCPDHQSRELVCKHMLCEILREQVSSELVRILAQIEEMEKRVNTSLEKGESYVERCSTH